MVQFNGSVVVIQVERSVIIISKNKVLPVTEIVPSFIDVIIALGIKNIILG